MATDKRKYLNPQTLATLANMQLRARMVVEGFIVGLHKSPYHGFSVEFAEHRAYGPGDNLRYLDWRLYGKTDRFYVKQFEEETNLKAHIMLDMSKSMAYGSADITKLQYGSYLSAAFIGPEDEEADDKNEARAERLETDMAQVKQELATIKQLLQEIKE